MALSDTARLIAELELRDKFSKPALNAERALGRLQRGFGQTGKGLGQVSAGLGRAAVRVVALGAAVASAGIGLLAIQIKSGIDSLRELQNVETQTNAVLTSTKGVAGQTADSVRALAERFEDLNATMDDKVIQSAENLLLTFTNIRGKAFEPAIQAILDMNQAMGGGEEGLQNTAILVGKALQDPVKGATALRRVGVQLSEQQQKQIKVLMEQNDLYGAQQIILKELAVEFGGSFAAAGTTAAAKSAKLRDKIEELQQTLARPIVPVIEKITDKLIDLFDKPATAAAVSNLGDTIAGLFTDQNLGTATRGIDQFLAKLTPENFKKVGDGIRSVFGFLEEIPWKTIGDGLRITGQAAKVAVEAFLSLPKEVQGIAIAALAVNKLSGGLVGTGIGTIAKGLGSLLTGGGLLGRGSSPANPMWVQSVGGVGGPGGLVGTAGRLSWLALLGPFVAAGVAGGLLGAAASEAQGPPTFGPTKLRSQEGADAMRRNTTAVEENTTALTNLGQFDPLNMGGTRKPIGGRTKAGIRALPDTAFDPGGGVVKLPDTAMSSLRNTATNTSRLPSIMDRQARTTELVAQRVNEARGAIGRGFGDLAATIRGKRNNIVVKVDVTSNVSVDTIQRRLTASRVATGTISEF